MGSVKPLLDLLSDTRQDLWMWLKMGKIQMTHDQDDMRRSEDLLTHGATTTKQLYSLYLLADLVRKQLLLLKFYLQLTTFHCDKVPRIDFPLNNASANKFERVLKQNDIPYIVTDAAGQITYANMEYCELTGYTKKQLVGQNPRILQSSQTSTDMIMQLKNYVESNPKEDKRMILLNCKKDGTGFWNNLYMAPISGPDGRIEKWIAASTDCTEVKDSLKMKPMVQAFVDVCRKMGQVLHKTLQSLGPLFGSPDWCIPPKWSAQTHTTALHNELEGKTVIHPDEQFLGEVQPISTTAEMSLFSPELKECETSIYAGAEGASVLIVNRQSWLQAHATEPISFLSRLPTFSKLPGSQLNALATKMKPVNLERGSVLCTTGTEVSHVYFVRSGSLELQVRVGEDSKPMKHFSLRESDRVLKPPRTKSFAMVGPGDVVEQAQQVGGKWISNCDVVASEGPVSLYMLHRSDLKPEWIHSVHTPQMQASRFQTRLQCFNNIESAAEKAEDMFALPPTKPLASEDLGWSGDYRCPAGVAPPQDVRHGSPPRSPRLPPLPGSHTSAPPRSPRYKPSSSKKRGRKRIQNTTEQPEASPPLPRLDGWDSSVLDDIDATAWDVMSATLANVQIRDEALSSLFPGSAFEEAAEGNIGRLSRLNELQATGI